LNWFFMFKMNLGHRGLALSTSLVALTNFLLLYIMMRKYAGPIETGAILGLLAKLVVPTLLLGGICWLALEFLFQGPLPEWQKIIGVLVVIAVAATVFFGSAFLLRVHEVRDIVDLVRRRFARNN